MSVAIGVVCFVLLVALLQWVRAAAGDAVERGAEVLISQVRTSAPTSWSIQPGTTDAVELATALRQHRSSGNHEGTTFAVRGPIGSQFVRCSTPATANLESARSEILRGARELDPGCELRL